MAKTFKHTFHLKKWDVNRLGILPDNWVQQINMVVETHSKICLLDGKASTSRELAGSPPIPVCVVSGGIIKVELPWLYDAYAGPFLAFAEQLRNEQLSVANDLDSSININTIRGLPLPLN